MKNQYKVLTILLVVIVALGIGVSRLYHAKYIQSYNTYDPDSGQTIQYNSSTNHDEEGLLLLTDEKLLKSGLTEKQFTTVKQTLIQTITELYSEKYKLASINSSSIQHGNGNDDYTFKVRLGEVDSKQYIFVTLTILDPDTVQILIKDDGDKTIKQLDSIRVE